MLCSALSHAQVQQLAEVILRAQRIQSSIQPISQTDIAQDSLLLKQDIGELLQGVPSLFVSSQQNFSQDTRISIRGFGTRATFGIRGIKILWDGIPMTTPDGQTQLDHIPLSSLGTIEVIRGVSSGLYGNASGGVIMLKSSPIKINKTLTATYGDFGSQHLVGSYGSKNEKNLFRAVAEHKKYHGYRHWSGYENSLINLSNTFINTNGDKLTVTYNYFNSPLALDAGGLTAAEVRENRSQARQRNLDYKAGEKVKQHQLTARWQNKKWTTYGFLAKRNLAAKLPFEFGGQIDLGRSYYGFGMQKDGRSKQWLWQYGVEAAAQRDGRKRFKNILGEKGAITLDQSERFYTLGVYGIVELTLRDWRLRGSLRADTHRIQLADYMGSNSDKKRLTAYSPSLAAFYSLSPSLSSYIRWGTGFETPSLNELSANPTGETGFNDTLTPQKSQEIEVGMLLKAKKIDASLVLYTTTTQDEILSYELSTFPGQDFFRNIGRVNKKGIEATANLRMAKTATLKLNYSHGTFKTQDGNDLPNVPKSQFSTGLNHLFGMTTVACNVRHVGKRYADSKNRVEVPKFWTADLYAQRKWGLTTWAVGIRNIANTSYYDNIRINAFGGRYFEPAAMRQAFARIQVQL
ncbi:MAG: TonB-dependent receptor [Flavobacteriaceae bacterium]|nr:TonB-dependent receptor [Flavobacteriaceae bacterium]